MPCPRLCISVQSTPMAYPHRFGCRTYRSYVLRTCISWPVQLSDKHTVALWGLWEDRRTDSGSKLAQQASLHLCRIRGSERLAGLGPIRWKIFGVKPLSTRVLRQECQHDLSRGPHIFIRPITLTHITSSLIHTVDATCHLVCQFPFCKLVWWHGADGRGTPVSWGLVRQSPFLLPAKKARKARRQRRRA